MAVNPILDRMISILYPPRCVLCDNVVEYETLWCGKCGLEAEGMVIRHKDPFEQVVSPMAYKGDVRRVLWKIKREPDPRAAAFLAQQMATALAHLGSPLPFGCIAYVPSSPQAMEQRGFNQAELLAVALSGQLGLPVTHGGLQRSDTTQVQHQLSAAERWRNARSSYTLCHEADTEMQGKRVLLIDDIFTTGATLNACGSLLKKAGAEAVYGATATYTAAGKPSAIPDMEERSCGILGSGVAKSAVSLEPLVEAAVLELKDLVENKGVRRVVLGLEPGFTIELADRLLDEFSGSRGFGLECCIPHEDHISGWTAYEQRRYLERYRAVLDHKNTWVEYIPPKEYSRGCQRWMQAYVVNSCDSLLAIWDGVSGKTGKMVRAAKEMAKPCRILDPTEYR